MNFDASLIAEIEVHYKTNVRAKDRPQIKSSKDAYEVMRSIWDDNKIDLLEQSKLMLLNRANRVLGIVDLSTGGVAGTVVDPKIVFATALKANSSSIILAHNHPSGSLTPSDADIELTKQMSKAGRLLSLPVRDHLIITRDSYYSFADEWSL